MELITAKKLAESLMDYHGLYDWNFKFDRAVKRFGQCSFGTKTISLSEPLTKLNSQGQVTDTILHEIAHALVGYDAGHGPEWKRVAIEVGANPHRTSDGVSPKAPYRLVCPNCGWSKDRFRKTTKKYACTKCCNTYNNGRYSPLYQVQWFDNRVGV